MVGKLRVVICDYLIADYKRKLSRYSSVANGKNILTNDELKIDDLINMRE